MWLGLELHMREGCARNENEGALWCALVSEEPPTINMFQSTPRRRGDSRRNGLTYSMHTPTTWQGFIIALTQESGSVSQSTTRRTAVQKVT